MVISIIAAVADNGVIGKGRQLPWHLPADLKYFKNTTRDHPVIMGRATFASIIEILGKPLPHRTNIVLSHEPLSYEGEYTVAGSLEESLSAARDTGAKEAFIAGGASVYEQFLPKTDKLYITEVHAEPAGDTYFPSVDWSKWQEISREYHDADERNRHPYSFVIYERAESESA